VENNIDLEGVREEKKIVDNPKSRAGEGQNPTMDQDRPNSTIEQQKTNQTNILSHAKRTTELVKRPANRNEPCTSDNANRQAKGKETARGSETEHVLCWK